MPARASASLIATPPSSAAVNAPSAPLILPIGVRAPATMYEPAMTCLLSPFCCAAYAFDGSGAQAVDHVEHVAGVVVTVGEAAAPLFTNCRFTAQGDDVG